MAGWGWGLGALRRGGTVDGMVSCSWHAVIPSLKTKLSLHHVLARMERGRLWERVQHPLAFWSLHSRERGGQIEKGCTDTKYQ